MQDLLRTHRRIAEHARESRLAFLLNDDVIESQALGVREEQRCADVQRGAAAAPGNCDAMRVGAAARHIEKRRRHFLQGLPGFPRRAFHHQPGCLTLHHRHACQRRIVALALLDKLAEIESLIGKRMRKFMKHDHRLACRVAASLSTNSFFFLKS